MKQLKNLHLLLLSFFIILPVFAQDEEQDQSSGGDSAAEASVTGSVSQPSTTSAGSIESNPTVEFVRAGISVAKALLFTPEQIKTIASVGSISDFKIIATTLDEQTITSTTHASNWTAVVESVADNANLSFSDFSTIADSAKSAFDNGTSLADLSIAISLSNSASSVTNSVSGIVAGTITTADLQAASTGGSWFAQFTSNSDLITLADTTSSSLGGTNSYLESAVALAESYITSVTLTSASDLPTDATVATLGTSVTYELLQLLNNYGAFGTSGDTIVSASSLSSGQSLTAASSTSDYLSYLGTIIGKSTIDKNLKDSSGNPISVINVPTSSIIVAGANKYTLGSASAASTVDVSTKLPAVSTADAESPANENIYIIGAIKDVFTAGAVNFTNTNDAEDHVLAIGAGDQVGIYHDITYTGSNLAIGQAGKTTGDTKTSVIDDKRALLIQADISTGGNLAIGSLGQIQVKGATFTLGTANETSAGSGVYTSDADNLYIYANDLIEINGLSFGSTARLDDVYMEAITINLKDVTFPSASDVFLRTRDGAIAFDTFTSPTVGAANFTNVVHPDVSSSALTSSDFTQQSNGQYQTTHNAITVGKL